MRVIFSRKGFDSSAGGCPSPIIDGQPISLPIPTRMPSPVRYVDLLGDYGALVEQLTKGKVTPRECQAQRSSSSTISTSLSSLDRASARFTATIDASRAVNRKKAWSTASE